jgi:DnaJ-domain-containing protein 1
MFGRNYYEVLEVAPSVSGKDLKEQFRKLMKLYHPDINQSSDAEARYAEVMEAYRVLADKRSRAMYDLSCSFAGASPTLRYDSPSSETRSDIPQNPREETMEARRKHYEKLLREKRSREQTQKDGSFSPYSYLVRRKVWLTALVSSFATAALSVVFERAASSTAAADAFGVFRAAFALLLLIWLGLLCLRSAAAYVGFRPHKVFFWLEGLACAYLYDVALGRLCGAAGYGDSFFIKTGNIVFLPGLLVSFLFFTYGALFLETKR